MTSWVHITLIHKYPYLFYIFLIRLIANVIYNIYNGFLILRLLYGEQLRIALKRSVFQQKYLSFWLLIYNIFSVGSKWNVTFTLVWKQPLAHTSRLHSLWFSPVCLKVWLRVTYAHHLFPFFALSLPFLLPDSF